jgi:hypothetical protein
MLSNAHEDVFPQSSNWHRDIRIPIQFRVKERGEN